MTASSTTAVPRIRVTPLIPRLCHWVNALAIFIMVGSGWRIYNSEPIVPGLIPYFNHRYTLGGDFELSFKLHGEPGLAGATLWHFAGMWLLVINFLVYVAYGLVSGRFRRKLLPLSATGVIADARAALTGRLSHADLSIYNNVQKLLYAGIIVVGVVVVLSGLSIWKPVQFHYLTSFFGGYDTARYVHFGAMAAIVAFLVVHVALAVLVPKSLRAMIIDR